MSFDSLWWWLLVGGNALVWARIVASIVGLVVAGVAFLFALLRK